MLFNESAPGMIFCIGFEYSSDASLLNAIHVVWRALLPPSNGDGCVFILVGWSVGLSVSNITKKQINGFSWNVRVSHTWHKEQTEISEDVPFNHLLTGWFYSIFVGESASVSIETKKGIIGFLWNCQDRFDNTQGTIWNILGMLCLTPWMQDYFSVFWVRIC